MAKLRQVNFTVHTTGVGRQDYSRRVEVSVEPVIKSWQSPYQEFASFNLAAGASHTEEFLIPSGYVVIPYDIYFSSVVSVALDLGIDIFSDNAYSRAIQKSGTQFIDIHLSKGVTFTTKYRIVVTNNGASATDCYFEAFGLTTTATQYGA